MCVHVGEVSFAFRNIEEVIQHTCLSFLLVITRVKLHSSWVDIPFIFTRILHVFGDDDFSWRKEQLKQTLKKKK